MRGRILLTCCFLVSAYVAVAVAETRVETSTESLLQGADMRLRAFYDRDEFRAKGFRADWLPDRSGDTVLEPVPDGKDPVLVRYDAASGERSVLEPLRKDMPGRSGDMSPDGRSVLVSVRGNLYVRDLDNDREIRLTNSPADSAVSNDRAVWSPDGKWVAFVQSDESAVRLRPVLVPGDPTYPEVKQVRFARVGEVIPTLRVGVADARGTETRWLSIPIPAEGYYLGQVEWAATARTPG